MIITKCERGLRLAEHGSRQLELRTTEHCLRVIYRYVTRGT